MKERKELFLLAFNSLSYRSPIENWNLEIILFSSQVVPRGDDLLV